MIPTITYQTLINIVSSYAKSLNNVANFSGMPSYFKSGSSIRLATYGLWGGVTEYVQMGISNPVTKISTSTIDSELNTFLNTIGVPSSARQYPIDDANLQNFIHDLVIFAARKFGCTMSNGGGASNERYWTYISGNAIDYNQTKTIYPKASGAGLTYTYNMSDIKGLLDRFFNTIRKADRVYPLTLPITAARA